MLPTDLFSFYNFRPLNNIFDHEFAKCMETIEFGPSYSGGGGGGGAVKHPINVQIIAFIKTSTNPGNLKPEIIWTHTHTHTRAHSHRQTHTHIQCELKKGNPSLTQNISKFIKDVTTLISVGDSIVILLSFDRLFIHL